MPARLSIVIPTMNAGQELPATMAHLYEGRDRGLVGEVIVSDSGSNDETIAVAQRADAMVIQGPVGRGGQLARGADQARCGWLLFLHADTHLLSGWSDVVADHMRGSTDAGYFTLQFRAKGIGASIVSGWANLRSWFGLPYGDQGLLISAVLYREIGGYADIPLMEDVAMARRLKGRLRGLAAVAATDASKYQREGWFFRGARNFWTLSKYLLGVQPDRLVQGYSGPPESEN